MQNVNYFNLTPWLQQNSICMTIFKSNWKFTENLLCFFVKEMPATKINNLPNFSILIKF